MTGIDIVEIGRIREKSQNETFVKSVFTQNETEYYVRHGKKAETLAGMFCAKEAVSKALGVGFRGFRPCDIEILHDENGAPYVKLHGNAARISDGKTAEISISHCREYAAAVCVICKE